MVAVGTGEVAMIAYASNTGTLRNLKALEQTGWRLLVTPEKPNFPSSLRLGSKL